jgi:hypothetical protein
MKQRQCGHSPFPALNRCGACLVRRYYVFSKERTASCVCFFLSIISSVYITSRGLSMQQMMRRWAEPGGFKHSTMPMLYSNSNHKVPNAAR